MARRRKQNNEAKPNVDMSPMIDLVFLLLIFFMIASTMITFKKDPKVKIPIALDGKVPREVKGRIVINVYADGSVYNEMSKAITLDEVEAIMAKAKASEPNTRLHLRADKNAKHIKVKQVIAASARGGVSEVIYSTYITGK